VVNRSNPVSVWAPSVRPGAARRPDRTSISGCASPAAATATVIRSTSCRPWLVRFRDPHVAPLLPSRSRWLGSQRPTPSARRRAGSPLGCRCPRRPVPLSWSLCPRTTFVEAPGSVRRRGPGRRPPAPGCPRT
jgi:hypothetical protein